MKSALFGWVILFAGIFVVLPVAADEEAPAIATTEGEVADAGPVVQERTLDDCRDDEDNDGDGHVDCADQDCEIYAICIQGPPVVEEVATAEEEVDPKDRPEMGLLCRDGKDNNEDGFVDCFEKSCQHYYYCRRQMYFIPESPNKMPGFYINIGGGIALPNYRSPTAKERSRTYNADVPFDPDMGLIANFKLGFLPLKWFGVGVNMSALATFATNEYASLESSDDPGSSKYQGTNIGGHLGGFVRFQWPFGRFVPFIDIAGGYSVYRHEWQVYDPGNDWEDIEIWGDDDDIDDAYNLVGDRDTLRFTTRHFTFAVEPGFDVFVVKRIFAIGLRAWMPIIASNDSSTDNVGVMFHLTVTPSWRERARMKPEYENPQPVYAEEIPAADEETPVAEPSASAEAAQPIVAAEAPAEKPTAPPETEAVSAAETETPAAE